MTNEKLLQDVRETLVRMTDLCGEALAESHGKHGVNPDILSDLLRELWGLRWNLNVRGGEVKLAPATLTLDEDDETDEESEVVQ